MSGDMSRRAFMEKKKRNKPIRTADARFVETVAGRRVEYSPSIQHGGAVVKYRDLTLEDTTISGVGAAMQEIRDIGVASGRFFTEQEERAATHVAVIGEDVESTLFPAGGSPLGRYCASTARNSQWWACWTSSVPPLDEARTTPPTSR